MKALSLGSAYERQKVMKEAPGKHRFNDKVRSDRIDSRRWMKSIPKDVFIRIWH
jgi:hypothetical protein